MNAAVVTRRFAPVFLVAAALLSGGWLMNAGFSNDDGTPKRLQKGIRYAAEVLTSPRNSASVAVPEPAGRYRAGLLILIMLPSPGVVSGPDGRAISLDSPEVLQAAAVECRLANRWSIEAATALARLHEMVKVITAEESGNTLTLQVTASARDEASQIADAIVAAFKSRLESSASDRSNRLMGPVQAQIKLRMEAVERTRNEMLEYMNSRAVIDYAFLDRLNGKPGAIQPELDAALSPDIKLAWFEHQLEDLRNLPAETATALMADAVIPFEHPVTKQCRVWQDLAPIADAVDGTPVLPNDGSVKPDLAFMKEQAAAALADYTAELQAWISRAAHESQAEISEREDVSASDQTRQNEYGNLKSRFEFESEQLASINEHAAKLFGNETPIYVPPVVVLKRSVERLKD